MDYTADAQLCELFDEYAKLYSGQRVLNRSGWPGLLVDADPATHCNYLAHIKLGSKEQVKPFKNLAPDEIVKMGWVRIEPKKS